MPESPLHRHYVAPGAIEFPLAKKWRRSLQTELDIGLRPYRPPRSAGTRLRAVARGVEIAGEQPSFGIVAGAVQADVLRHDLDELLGDQRGALEPYFGAARVTPSLGF